jgi:hypothetical protein
VGRLSATLKTELQKQSPDVCFILAVTIAGTTYRWGALGEPGRIDSASGLYEPRVLSWGGAYSRGVNLRSNALEFAQMDVLLDDTDQTIAKIVEGPNRHSVRGATAILYLASRNVAAASWLTLYSGRVETYSQPSPLLWSLQLAPRDLPLQRESIPKVAITKPSWPNAQLAVIDLDVPIIYGRHSSVGGTNTGAVPTDLVDQVGFRYLVCAGWAKAIDMVYKDGVDVPAANYAITHPIVNGRVYTLIDFTASQGTSSITCDLQGLEDVGDGSGALIVDPPTIAKHVLVNWIYGDYKAGAWLSDSTAPVDTASFGTTFFSSRGTEASLYVGLKRRGVDVVNDFLASFEAKAYWTFDGKLALAVEDFTAWSYVTDLVVREDEIGGWSLTHPVANLVDRVEAQYGLAPVDSSYKQKLVAVDLVTGEAAPDKIPLPYSPAFLF